MRKVIGVDANGGDVIEVLERIDRLESLGIDAAWVSDGQIEFDALSVLTAAAVRTERIMLGTAIVRTWPRHPLVSVQQSLTLAKLAPGRTRLGVGPAHRGAMEETFGFEFRAPLTNLREYLQITKALLQVGHVDFDGRHYHAHTSSAETAADVPVMASALRPASFKLCGALADGAISWMCPAKYLRDVALPALQQGAAQAGRAAPPLVAHVPICVHDDLVGARVAAVEQNGYYPQSTFYAQMFAEAGFPEAIDSAQWSDGMLDAVLVAGPEERVAARLNEILDWGVSELLVSVVSAGPDPDASWERSVALIANLR